MLKLKEGYTVYSYEPQYGDRDEVYDVEYEAVQSRLSLFDAIKLVGDLKAWKGFVKASHSYGYAPDLKFYAGDDPATWIDDSDDYDALVEAGEIVPREYSQ
jgi:hypothetical protein